MNIFRTTFLSVTASLALIATSCQSTSNSAKSDTLRMNMNDYTSGTVSYKGKEIAYRAYEGIVYVANPVDTDYQTINIYVPEEYFKGGSVNGYTAQTAPIFFPNTVGGYMPGKAGTLKAAFGDGTSASVVALANGLVVASPGARGRTNQDSNGKFTGKAPACIVDLKAAVRYLRHNKDLLPGDTEKIISNGTSAGGALSALLAASGNSKDYEPYLKAIGAANERDDIFAASVYCPITNLDNANEAYEWQFEDVNDYQKMDISMLDYHVERKLIKGSLSNEEIALSHEFASRFPAYLKTQGLTAEELSSLIMGYVEKSLNDKIASLEKEGTAESAKKKAEILARPYIKNGSDGKLSIDRASFFAYIGRQKLPGAFDSLNADTGENSLFGDENTDFKHFTDYALKNSKNDAPMADSKIVKIMNAMNYLKPSEKSDVAKFWRIRHGTSDKDTAFAIPVLLSRSVENDAKASVDFYMPWDIPHSGDYDLDELFSWINEIAH